MAGAVWWIPSVRRQTRAPSVSNNSFNEVSIHSPQLSPADLPLLNIASHCSSSSFPFLLANKAGSHLPPLRQCNLTPCFSQSHLIQTLLLHSIPAQSYPYTLIHSIPAQSYPYDVMLPVSAQSYPCTLMHPVHVLLMYSTSFLWLPFEQRIWILTLCVTS